MPTLGSAAIGRQLGSLSSLLSPSSISAPHSDPGLSATLMQGQHELGAPPQKQIGGTSFEPEYLSPFDAPHKQNPSDLFGGQQSFSIPTSTSPYAQNGGAIGSLGGEYAVLDQYDAYFQEAAAATGVPVNTLKAIAAVERGWEGTSVAGAQGIMQVMPFWGQDFGLDLSDPRQNILAGAKVLASNLAQYGSLDMAIRGYLGFGQDAYGTTDTAYLQRVQQFQSQLDQSGGSFGQTQPIGGLWGGTEQGHNIVSIAEQYLGTPYVWGGIPGKGETPTGWDCSGFTYWLDQNYGSGQLPMGSHYQYQYAQSSGQLFSDTSQLQPGDLIFFDTGWQGGAGAEMNRAGHVAMYIGNGQIIHAANPDQGTIISQLSGYYLDRFLGAMHGSFAGATGGGYTGSSPQANPGGGSFISSIRQAMQHRNP